MTHDKFERGATVNAFSNPYFNQDAECMVQLLTTLLCGRNVRKKRSDDRITFASNLRCRHGLRHFVDMYAVVEESWKQMDDGGPQNEFRRALFDVAKQGDKFKIAKLVEQVRHLSAPLFAPFNRISYYYGVFLSRRCVLPQIS